jgi:hypothetical protein
MSLDRIWMCPSLKREDWVEVFSKSRRLTTNDETFSVEAIDEELKKYGQFSVSLTSGAYDERYLFLQEEDARRFFVGGPLDPGECGYRERERMAEGEVPGTFDIGLGFDRVQLYVCGELVESK